MDPDVVVRVSFSDDLDVSTVTADSLSLLDVNEAVIASNTVYDAVTFTTALTPDAPLAFGAQYTIRLTPDIAGTTQGALPLQLVSAFEVIARQGCQIDVECRSAQRLRRRRNLR